MPWCPNCKSEYQEGYTTCTDCGSDLVDSIEQAVIFKPIFYTSKEKLAEKLVRFFEYSDLNSQMQYDESTEVYTVLIPSSEEKEARKLYEAFYFVENTRFENQREGIEDLEETEEEVTDVEDDIYHNIDPASLDEDPDENQNENAVDEDVPEYRSNKQTTAYVMKTEQFKELSSTVWIFITFGVAGLIVVLLNAVQLLELFSGIIPNLVMGALFLGFIYIGISTNKKAKKVKAEIYDELKTTEQINDWLKLNITDSFLASIHDDAISEEVNHIKKTDIIKEMLIKEFGPLNLAYLDRLIDEFYDSEIEVEE